MNAQLGRSRRGGASAPPACKSKLRSCVVGGIREGGSARSMMSSCFSEFNACRSGRKRKATGGKKRRKGKSRKR